MNRIEQARDIVRRYPLPETLHRLNEQEEGLSYYNGIGTAYVQGELTPEVLAQSLHYLVELELRTIDDESAVPLGASKYKGLPDLPSDIEWPAGMYFMAQFNCAELHPFDVYDTFPDTGMLYIFFSPEGEADLRHYDGPLDALRVAQYPAPATLPDAKYYLKEFTDNAALIDFSPACIFYLGGDAYDMSEGTDAIPDELKSEVAAVMGCPVVSWDTDLRIFGRPMYWQGEDELFDDDDDDDATGEVVAEDAQSEPWYVLFQDEFGEGHIHVWIDPANARKRDYSDCFLDYSGT